MVLDSLIEKLTIKVEGGGEIKVQYNPNKVSLSRSSKWKQIPKRRRDVPPAQFTSGTPETLTIELFFDTYESATPVTDHTDKIDGLTRIEKHGSLHRPPICDLIWGRGLTFQGVLTSLSKTFSLFLSDGTPVRATLNCTFTQWRSDKEEERLLNLQSPDVHKIHTVRRGDTLSSIATTYYANPGYWRHIASENGIDNPRRIQPGQILTIPILKPEDR